MEGRPAAKEAAAAQLLNLPAPPCLPAAETRKEVPDQLPLEMPVDRSGRVTTVAKRIKDRPSAVPFMSKQVRAARFRLRNQASGRLQTLRSG